MSHSRLSFACAAVLAAAISGCAGGQQSSVIPQTGQAPTSGAPLITAQNTTSVTPAPTTTPQTSSLLTTSGTIGTVSSTGFTLQTGNPHGWVRIATSSSTRYIGAKPYTNESVTISGTGWWLTSIAASWVTQSGYATPTPAATATPVPTPTPMPVKTSTPLPVGSPTSAPIAPGSVPSHIPTWAYDEFWAQGATATTAQVRQYVSYAQSGLGNAKASNDCSNSGVCKSVFYFDPHMIYDYSSCASAKLSPDVAGLLAQGQESWYVHEAGHSDYAHRVRGSYTTTCNGASTTIPVWGLNSSNPSVAAYWQSYLHTYAAAFDEFFLDDTSGQVLTQFYGAGGGFCHDVAPNHWCTTTQELPTDASVVAEHGALASALTHPDGSAMQGVFNGLNFSNGRPNDLGIMTSSSHFVAAVCEGCVVSGGALRPTMYAQVLNAMAQIDAMPGDSIVLMSNGASAPGSAAQIQQRLLTSAIVWLGFSPGHTMVWPNLENNTQNLAVFPENSIYPTGPLQSMTSGATDIAVTSGVYRREFANCYNAGAPIGPCAAIVNSTSATITVPASWLKQAYGHSVTLSGGDIPNGGTLSLTSQPFAANATAIPAGAGLLLVR